MLGDSSLWFLVSLQSWTMLFERDPIQGLKDGILGFTGSWLPLFPSFSPRAELS